MGGVLTRRNKSRKKNKHITTFTSSANNNSTSISADAAAVTLNKFYTSNAHDNNNTFSTCINNNLKSKNINYFSVNSQHHYAYA